MFVYERVGKVQFYNTNTHIQSRQVEYIVGNGRNKLFTAYAYSNILKHKDSRKICAYRVFISENEN